MPKTFSFNQLSEEAKQKVLERERFVNVDDYDWWDWIYETLKEYGIETEQVSFDLQNHYFCVHKGSIDHEKMISYLWHNGYITVQQAYAIRDELVYIWLKTSFRYGCDRNYFTVEATDEVPDKVYDGLEEAMDAFIEDVEKDCLKKLEQDYEGLTSDEAIIEMLMANDWHFTKDGERA